jgi:Family of unknown function (DUF6879)
VTRRTDDEFMELYSTAEHTGYQLERRESYAGVDAEPFGRFMAGDLANPDPWEPWRRNVRAQTAAGRRFTRVRVVSEPWSDYTRFGLWSCRSLIEAGEDIRHLSRPRAVELGLPEHDYRFFDSRLSVVLHYDDKTNDLVSRVVVTDPATIVQHNYWRDLAWHHAVPRDQYVEQVGKLVVQPQAGA